MSKPEARTEVVPRFLALQDSLLECFQKANGLDLTQVKVVSPASPLIRLRLGAYLESTVGHEEYYLLQAQAVRAHPAFPVSSSS